MKEWQRWEAMAGDFATVGDRHRQAECLEMALEILPPGHKDDKARLRDLLAEARTKALETAGPPSEEGSDAELDERLREELEALGPEDARSAVMAVVRRRCTTVEGAPEVKVLDQVVAATRLERELVREALEEMVDEGLVYRGRPGRIMLDGVVEEEDLETAALSVLAELSTGGRGGARRDVVAALVDRGFSRDEVDEAVDDLVEEGRLDEDHHGQLRPALDTEGISEVHHMVMAALEEMDPEDTGVLAARLEMELTGRGLELDEVREALDDLVDTGDVVRDGAEVRAPRSTSSDREARSVMLEVIHALSEDRARPVPVMKVLRTTRARGLTAVRAHRTLDDLVDDGSVWRTDLGIHLAGEGETPPERAREAVLAAVRELAGRHGMGAPEVEVIDLAIARGLEELEARETLEDLVDDGLVHDAGGGFLRPG